MPSLYVRRSGVIESRILLYLASRETGRAQSRALEGVVDIDADSGPDSVPRSIDAVDLARNTGTETSIP